MLYCDSTTDRLIVIILVVLLLRHMLSLLVKNSSVNTEWE